MQWAVRLWLCICLQILRGGLATLKCNQGSATTTANVIYQQTFLSALFPHVDPSLSPVFGPLQTFPLSRCASSVLPNGVLTPRRRRPLPPPSFKTPRLGISTTANKHALSSGRPLHGTCDGTITSVSGVVGRYHGIKKGTSPLCDTAFAFFQPAF